MQVQEILGKAREVREQEHRLRPSLRLRTLEEIREFIHSRGIVSVFGGNELPSVINAILGREWKPSKKGFTSWEDWWSIKISGESAGHALAKLDRDRGILGTRIFRSGKTLVSKELWSILDPIVKHHQELAAKHEILSGLEWKILKLLDAKGPTRTDHLRAPLKLEGKTFTNRFHRALSRLESYALIVGYEDPKPERHLHANIWQLWGQRVQSKKAYLSYEKALTRLLEKTVDACVLASASDVEKWFQWNGSLTELVQELVESGKVLKADNFLVASRIGSTVGWRGRKGFGTSTWEMSRVIPGSIRNVRNASPSPSNAMG